MVEIKIIHGKGVDELGSSEKDIVLKLVNEYLRKIERGIKDLSDIEVYVKEYKKQGDSKKYSVQIKLLCNSNCRFNSDASDWDLTKTIRIALDKMVNHIEHELHVSDQNKGEKNPRK